jgi:hypothetical protein
VALDQGARTMKWRPGRVKPSRHPAARQSQLRSAVFSGAPTGRDTACAHLLWTRWGRSSSDSAVPPNRYLNQDLSFCGYSLSRVVHETVGLRGVAPESGRTDSQDPMDRPQHARSRLTKPEYGAEGATSRCVAGDVPLPAPIAGVRGIVHCGRWRGVAALVGGCPWNCP